MPIEIAALATTAVAQILLPYLKEGAHKLAEAASEKFGETAGDFAVDLADKVWTRVKAAFTSDRDKATLVDFEEDPESAKPLMEKKLQAKLEQDLQLATELETLVHAFSPDGKSTGAQIIGATYAGIVDLRGGAVSGGVVGGIVMGNPSPPPGPGPSLPPPRKSSTPGANS